MPTKMPFLSLKEPMSMSNETEPSITPAVKMGPDIKEGLKGVVFTQTKLTFIDGEKGILKYVGIPIGELAETSSFEEVCFLLLNARLPQREELEAFEGSLRARRVVDARVMAMVMQFPREIHPMHALRTTVSLLALFDPQADDLSEAGKLDKAYNLIAQFPTIIAALYRLRQGQEPLEPRSDLGHAANFLYLLSGTEPSTEQARLLDIALILHADHGMNASTFTAIATASTLSDMYSAITSAIGALKGPLHGGANEAVMDMLDQIGTADLVEDYINDKLARKEKIMGVGHAVYKYFDPRSRTLKAQAAVVALKHGKSDYYQVLEKVEEVVVARLGSRGIYPNVDFYSGVVYSDLGISKDFFTPIFALARISGWMASVIEYTRKNSLLRPSAHYIGPEEAHWLPFEER
jgi:citrate synthase